MSKKIVVLGATGQQGGAVVEALKAAGGFSIVTPARNPESTAAKKLAEDGCEVPKLSSFENVSELTSIFQGVDGVYAVTTFLKSANKFDVEMEKRQGKSIVEAAKAASVPFMVFSSCGSCADKTGVPHFESKMYIEELIDEAGINCFAIRPVCFMDNLGTEFQPLVKGKYTSLCDTKTKLQLVAVSDIGKLAAVAFQNPDKFKGKKLEFAGDFLSGVEQGAALGKMRGEAPYKAKSIPGAVLWLFAHEFYLMKRFFETKGFHADIEECKSYLPSLLTFEDFLKSKGYDKCEVKQPSACSIQ